ncbi:unnamed protein product [Cuscuta campestris]|uniref:Glycosyltransferase 2-like domain-containing protein n=1 Tax=Cuscuta campestris TaxID=132261 RepID=A0A484K863_9ASTE|nr:unnamed protein product [Cuscuta campestris]
MPPRKPPSSPLSFPPLYEIRHRNNRISRAVEVIILCLLFLLITYRLISLYSHRGGGGFLLFPWFLALVCESWFTFLWILTVNSKWNQIDTHTYPQRLLQRVKDGTVELPAVDMFVTTADSDLEPPILTVNTVLSLLAVDYPASKLACYVSDDGASPLTFYSLLQAAKFARLWVPFCKKFNVAVRAPFQYFNNGPECSSLEFQHEWKEIKGEYSQLCAKIEDASKKPMIFDLTGEFSEFTKIEKRNHSTIIKVIWENNESLTHGDEVPNIIYISREKRLKHPHHYKAGAMNVLTRVSGVMTNAPFMVNVDCDCYVNDPKVVMRAMCILLGAEDEKDAGFVQFPQSFYGALEDDPYGNQFKVLMKYMVSGFAGIQGPFYQGTGCFHRRKVIYGSSPNKKEGESDKDIMLERYGKSKDAFVWSVVNILSSQSNNPCETSPPICMNSLEAAYQVAHSGYEFGTSWGYQVGWIYGSTTEDMLTGLTIHRKGWRSALCDHKPFSFLGCAPTGGPAALTQQKRWATGLMEILISNNNPIVGTSLGRLKFRQCLCYLWFMAWPMRPIFELSYSLLPAYCIFTNSHFQPKVNEGVVAIAIPSSIFIIYNLYTLFEYVNAGESIRAWWNNQRMQKVTSSASWFLGFLSGVFKVVGFSDTVFEVTKKEHYSDGAANTEQPDDGTFTFDDSPLFILGTTILLVNIAALFIGFVDYVRKEKVGWSLGEVICSVWVILMYWAFLKGLFRRGKYGIPWSIILKSGGLAFLFLHASKFVH